jgi:hypothetical protein
MYEVALLLGHQSTQQALQVALLTFNGPKACAFGYSS